MDRVLLSAALTAPRPERLAGLAAAALLIAAGVQVVDLPLIGLGGCVVWTLAAMTTFGVYSLVALGPAVGLLLGGGMVALLGWSLAALALGWAVGALVDERRWRGTADLRADLREAEHEVRHLRATIRRHPALLEASLELSESRELDQFAHILCRQARRLAPEALTLAVHLGTTTSLGCRASMNEQGAPCPENTGETERYVAKEARALTRRQDGITRIAIPLRGDRRREDREDVLRGVLVATLPQGNLGERMATELLQSLCLLGGLALAAVDLVDQARALALTDDLTGLFGQHEFLRRLEEQIATARRLGHPLTVVMCDLDHLKRFNDAWGHQAGDQALIAVAGALNALVTEVPGVIACRYGGEEFALLAPRTDAEAGMDLAERLRRAIARVSPDPEHPERGITASLGVAVARHQENGRAVLIRADAACYRAKADGRNRVESAEFLDSIVGAGSGILPRIRAAGGGP